MAPISGRRVLCTPTLTKAESAELLSVIGEQGPDPSSKNFTSRRKSIGFVLCLEGKWYQLNHNYFCQATSYNPQSGGFKRNYEELPREFIQNKIAQKVLTKLKKIHAIPDADIICITVQTSYIRDGDNNKCMTGHGIHSDGTDKAMLMCLARRNVKGALNSFYGDAEGTDVIVKPFVLEEGHAAYWADNVVYHHVSPGAPADGTEVGERTVLVANYPGKFLMDGSRNPNNTLPSR